jgi:hypothetical protein
MNPWAERSQITPAGSWSGVWSSALRTAPSTISSELLRQACNAGWFTRLESLTAPPIPNGLMSPPALSEAIKEVRERVGPWTVHPRTRGKDAWQVLALGMSRDVVGLSTLEAAGQFGVPRSSAGHALLEHRRLLLSDSCYAKRAAEVLRLGLRITFGPGREARVIPRRSNRDQTGARSILAPQN